MRRPFSLLALLPSGHALHTYHICLTRNVFSHALLPSGQSAPQRTVCQRANASDALSPPQEANSPSSVFGNKTPPRHNQACPTEGGFRGERAGFATPSSLPPKVLSAFSMKKKFSSKQPKPFYRVLTSRTIICIDFYVIICQIASPRSGLCLAHLHVCDGCHCIL